MSDTAFDRAILQRASQGTAVATHWFSGYEGYPKSCAAARRILYRLAESRLVQPVRSSRSGHTYWWRITDAGRAKLTELGAA